MSNKCPGEIADKIRGTEIGSLGRSKPVRGDKLWEKWGVGEAREANGDETAAQAGERREDRAGVE